MLLVAVHKAHQISQIFFGEHLIFWQVFIQKVCSMKLVRLPLLPHLGEKYQHQPPEVQSNPAPNLVLKTSFCCMTNSNKMRPVPDLYREYVMCSNKLCLDFHYKVFPTLGDSSSYWKKDSSDLAKAGPRVVHRI